MKDRLVSDQRYLQQQRLSLLELREDQDGKMTACPHVWHQRMGADSKPDIDYGKGARDTFGG
jgi:hypothetical protein